MSEEERDQLLAEEIIDLRKRIILAKAEINAADAYLSLISDLGINTDVLKEKVLKVLDDLRRVEKDTELNQKEKL